LGQIGCMYSTLDELEFRSSPPSTRYGWPSTMSCVTLPRFSRCGAGWFDNDGAIRAQAETNSSSQMECLIPSAPVRLSRLAGGVLQILGRLRQQIWHDRTTVQPFHPLDHAFGIEYRPRPVRVDDFVHREE